MLCATLIHLKEIRAAAAIVAFFVRVASIAAVAFITTAFAAAFTVAIRRKGLLEFAAITASASQGAGRKEAEPG